MDNYTINEENGVFGISDNIRKICLYPPYKTREEDQKAVEKLKKIKIIKK